MAARISPYASRKTPSLKIIFDKHHLHSVDAELYLREASPAQDTQFGPVETIGQRGRKDAEMDDVVFFGHALPSGSFSGRRFARLLP
jgi:hypothetical protein